ASGRMPARSPVTIYSARHRTTPTGSTASPPARSAIRGAARSKPYSPRQPPRISTLLPKMTAAIFFQRPLTSTTGLLHIISRIKGARDRHPGSHRGIAMTTRVLLTEDNEALAHMLQRFLAAQGHEVLLAKTGGDALQLLASRDFSLLVLDLRLPD